MSRRRLVWIATGLVLGALAGLLWTRWEPSSPLDAERLAAARARWEEAGLRSYVVELELSGALSDRRRIEVRDGEVVAMTTGTAAVPRQSWKYWTVQGMFDFLAAELDNAAAPQRAYGVSDPEAVVLRARFHPRLGYPERFLRHVMGQQGSSVAWTVVRLEAGAGAGG